MNFADPFPGYSLVLRLIIYGLVPAFGVWQFLRLKRALHVFQLEGYKRARFLEWCRANRARARFINRARARFINRATGKKPLSMTGRAWRILILATFLSIAMILVASGAAHLAGGWPFDVTTWAITTALVFFLTPRILVASDWLLAPVQAMINGRYLRAARQKLERISPVVIGITGSFGKTSTKFAVQGLLGPAAEVLATPGSFNTPMGVCRTINEHLQSPHRFFVVEMGAYGEGEIAEICDLVHPSIGVLTAVGPAHLERFGSLDAIRRAKYEIVSSLPHDGVAVMNVDDPEVRSLADATDSVEVVRYGIDMQGRPHVTAKDIETRADGTELTIIDERTGGSIRAHTRLLGRHAVGHILAGVSVAVATGRSLEGLTESIRGLQPVEHRLQIIEGTGGVTVVDDAFNSNPEGAAAALEVLEAMPHSNKVIVTPGIIELGEMQDEANRRFGERAAQVSDTLVVVARVNRDAIVAGAGRADGGGEVIVVDSLAEAQARLRSILGPGSVVLFENDLPDHYED
jgi:UDP-N-acetylmuramoyl-tripeptide--D-alanyl-D-alanine ligase